MLLWCRNPPGPPHGPIVKRLRRWPFKPEAPDRSRLGVPYGRVVQRIEPRISNPNKEFRLLSRLPKEDGGRKFIVLFLLATIINLKIGSNFDFNSKGGNYMDDQKIKKDASKPFQDINTKNSTLRYIDNSLKNIISLLKIFNDTDDEYLKWVFQHLEEASYQIELYLQKNNQNSDFS